MLGRRVDELPEGEPWRYEPKWDGFRAVAFREGNDVDIRGRNDTDSGRYFPEVVAGLRRLRATRFVLDGEIVATKDGRADFGALMLRLHPAASRVERLSRETPATFVAFDVLALGDRDLRGLPYDERRRILEGGLDGAELPIQLTPATDDPVTAASWLDVGGAVDGVMVKSGAGRYEDGKRSWHKVKRVHTADCVVAGFRVYDAKPAISSLMLGLWDDTGTLHHVGIVASFTAADRGALADRVGRYAVDDLAGHPWEHGFNLEGGALGRLKGAPGRWTPAMERDWHALRPELVAEVAYDQTLGHRFRHPGRLVRWRPDREASTCRVDQLDHEVADAVGR
jgi:ATP-dependent DNA ligase